MGLGLPGTAPGLFPAALAVHKHLLLLPSSAAVLRHLLGSCSVHLHRDHDSDLQLNVHSCISSMVLMSLDT